MQLDVFVCSGQGFCSKHQGRFLSGDAVWLVQDSEAASVTMDSESKPVTAVVIEQGIILKCSFSRMYNILFILGFGNIPEYFYLIEMLKGVHAQGIRGWSSEPKPQRSISHTKTALQRQELGCHHGNSKQISSCDRKRNLKRGFCYFLGFNVLL